MGIELVVDLMQLDMLESQIRNASTEFNTQINALGSHTVNSVQIWGGRDIASALDSMFQKQKHQTDVIFQLHQDLAQFVRFARTNYFTAEQYIGNAARV